MDRRQFISSSIAASAAASAAGLAPSSASAADGQAGKEGKNGAFNLHYAPHFGTFRHLAGKDPIDQLKFAADQGFTAWEDNGMKRKPVDLQKKIARTMEQRDMRMGVFVAHGSIGELTFAVKDKDRQEKVLKDIRESVEVAKRVNAKWMTVVPGNLDERNNKARLEIGYQRANVIEMLRRCAEIFEPHGMVMVLEPLNWHANHGGVFLQYSDQAYAICKAVDSPACKILFDIYHQQITEGNLIPNLDKCWDEIGYFQCGDNPGRNEPGTGEINYHNVFRHIHQKGYKGILGMEHGAAGSGKAGERAVIEAYRKADSF